MAVILSPRRTASMGCWCLRGLPWLQQAAAFILVQCLQTIMEHARIYCVVNIFYVWKRLKSISSEKGGQECSGNDKGTQWMITAAAGLGLVNFTRVLVAPLHQIFKIFNSNRFLKHYSWGPAWRNYRLPKSKRLLKASFQVLQFWNNRK